MKKSYRMSAVYWENPWASFIFHRDNFQKKKTVPASRHPILTGPDVTCFSFFHSAVSCLAVCVGMMPGWCSRLWWAHGWKAAEEKTTCHSESVRTPPEATTPPSMSSSHCFRSLALALHECSFSGSLCVLFVPFQFTYFGALIPNEPQFLQSPLGPLQAVRVIAPLLQVYTTSIQWTLSYI